MKERGVDPTRGTRIRVDCYEGYRAQETPRRFTIAGRTVEVGEILNRWTAPDHRFFRVAGRDGRSYLLSYRETEGVWRLVSGARDKGLQDTPPDP